MFFYYIIDSAALKIIEFKKCLHHLIRNLIFFETVYVRGHFTFVSRNPWMVFWGWWWMILGRMLPFLLSAGWKWWFCYSIKYQCLILFPAKPRQFLCRQRWRSKVLQLYRFYNYHSSWVLCFSFWVKCLKLSMHVFCISLWSEMSNTANVYSL